MTNKKLINYYFNKNNINIINIINTKEMTNKQKIEKSNNISNKSSLKEKIHEIHNYLRNNGAGYGMNALKVFNILYGLKKIEEKNLIDKVKLKRPDCEFSYLLKLANQNKVEELAELIFKNVLESINTSSIKYLLAYNIPTIIKGSILTYLIKEIDKITIIEKTCNVLLSGKIYEYFIGRDETAISELGAYFTDRHIVDYCYKKLDPKINKDCSINTMIDMFGGSGGFTTGYINYLNDNNKEIDWEKNINNIYHYDMNEDVIKSAGLEIFCSTGVLPNNNNIAYKNSFSDSFNDKKFTYIITNPPYGGDNVKYTDTCNKRTKIKEYIKKELLLLKDKKIIKIRNLQIKKLEQEEIKEKNNNDKNKVSVKNCSQRIINYAKENKVTGKDKESVSLILIMELLEESGTAICVLKEGVFFNKLYKDLRKCLIENFNVREIISIPQDQFENTLTKTSIIIFDNTQEKTVKVKFYDLSVTHYSEDKFEEINNEIVIVENKDDISNISDKLICEVSKEEILKNPIYSLNWKDYNKKEIIINKNYEIYKLGDISDINIGATPNTKNDNYWNNCYHSNNGSYPWITVGELNNNIIFDTKKHITNEGQKIMKNKKIPINSILLSFKLSIGKIAIAGIEMYCNEAIVYLNSKNKKIQQMYLYYILQGLNLENYGRGTIGSYGCLNKEILFNLQIPIPKSEQKMVEWTDKISKEYNKKNNFELKIKELEENIRNKIKDIEENEDCDKVELGSICEILCGKKLTKDKSIVGNYNVYGGGETSYTHNQYNLEGFNILISRVGNNNIKLINEKIYLTDNGFSLLITDMENKKYIGYYLLNNEDKILNISIGSAQKVISKTKLSTIKIKIPKNKKLIKNLEPVFEEIEKLQTELKEAELQYKQLIKELSEETILINKQIENNLEEQKVIKKVKK